MGYNWVGIELHRIFWEENIDWATILKQYQVISDKEKRADKYIKLENKVNNKLTLFKVKK